MSALVRRAGRRSGRHRLHRHRTSPLNIAATAPFADRPKGKATLTVVDGVVVDGLAPYELTTLVQPAADKGRAAGQAVAAMLAGEPAASIRFTCVFRVGNTTGPRP